MDQSANEPVCPAQRDDEPTALTPVQSAEEIVSSAWIRELMSASADADTAVWAAFQVREQAMAVLREALMSAEPRSIAAAQASLDEAVRDLAESLATRNGVQDLLDRERTDRPWADWLRLSGAQ
jgi:hypothetical protein